MAAPQPASLSPTPTSRHSTASHLKPTNSCTLNRVLPSNLGSHLTMDTIHMTKVACFTFIHRAATCRCTGRGAPAVLPEFRTFSLPPSATLYGKYDMSVNDIRSIFSCHGIHRDELGADPGYCILRGIMCRICNLVAAPPG